MKKTDVLIIGGSAAGLVAGMTAKSNFPEKSVTLIRKEEKVMIPCGIPYIFGTVETSDANILPDAGLVGLGVEIVVDEVVQVEREKNTCKTKNGESYSYDKLIIATGSQPIVPKWLKGAELKNVITVPKDKEYLDRVQKDLEHCKKIVTIGSGFIGVELSDELNKLGKEVYLVEILPHILGLAFDEELAIEAENLLKNRGVNLITGSGVKEILGTDKVEGVLLNNGETIEADAVVLSMGYQPNVDLAKDMGLEINDRGFIKVDQYRRTAYDDIFAAGDCAEKVDYNTGKLSSVMLASTACAEARVAGMNLFGLSCVKTFPGTIGIYATCIGDLAMGAAGLTETGARKEGFDVVVGAFQGVDRHPGKFEDASKQLVKLIAAKESGILLGGEVIGGKGTGELINVIGIAIQNNMTISQLLTLQIGTHPMLTASPAGYPLVKAAEIIAKKMK